MLMSSQLYPGPTLTSECGGEPCLESGETLLDPCVWLWSSGSHTNASNSLAVRAPLQTGTTHYPVSYTSVISREREREGVREREREGIKEGERMGVRVLTAWP